MIDTTARGVFSAIHTKGFVLVRKNRFRVCFEEETQRGITLLDIWAYLHLKSGKSRKKVGLNRFGREAGFSKSSLFKEKDDLFFRKEGRVIRGG